VYDGSFISVKARFFERVALPFIEQHRKRGGRRPKVGDYHFFCGVLYRLRTGLPWRDLPPCFGPWHTIDTRYKRWSEIGFFWKLFYNLQSLKRMHMDIVFVDDSLVPLHRHGLGSLKK
jgi:transposase